MFFGVLVKFACVLVAAAHREVAQRLCQWLRDRAFIREVALVIDNVVWIANATYNLVVDDVVRVFALVARGHVVHAGWPKEISGFLLGRLEHGCLLVCDQLELLVPSVHICF